MDNTPPGGFPMSDDAVPDDALSKGPKYDLGFSWDLTYARAARLIASQAPVGLVVDLGAGVGTLGDAVELFGLRYVGLDGDRANIKAIATSACSR
jgi:predicted RNA methylase